MRQSLGNDLMHAFGYRADQADRAKQGEEIPGVRLLRDAYHLGALPGAGKGSKL